MVNIPQIEHLLNHHYSVRGSYTIDPETGVVDVTGDVELMSFLVQMPVQFGHVSGYFSCTNNQLTSLTGAPHEVGGDFWCHSNTLNSLVGAPHLVKGDFACHTNHLQTLEGAPTSVGANLWCQNNPLKSLDGAPGYVGGEFGLTYDENLPLLRCLIAKTGTYLNKAPKQVEKILNDSSYVGKGKAAAIKVAAELVKAGFKGNARW